MASALKIPVAPSRPTPHFFSMTPYLRLALFVGLSLVATFAATSCQTKRGGASTEGYIPPPTLKPVDATDRMRDQYRQWR